jgi:hypothetical protein
MKMRGRRCRVTVALQKSDWPVILTLGPGNVLEATAEEARALAIDICDALEAIQRGALG